MRRNRCDLLPNAAGHQRSGYTLLELVATSFIVGSVMVPSLAFMRDAAVHARRIETRATMQALCSSLLEEQCGKLADRFESRSDAGDLSHVGQPEMRYSALSTSANEQGGITDRLMVVQVTVWQDLDGNARRELREPSVTLRTKMSLLQGA